MAKRIIIKTCQFCNNSFVQSHSHQHHCSLKCRFWDKVIINEPNECWIWTGANDGRGYGQLRVDHKCIRAPRLSWELIHGKIPDGLNALHKCDNPRCVNPRHLFLGTQKENAKDMMEKGRNGFTVHIGEHHGCAKLSNEDVVAIKKFLKQGLSSTKIMKHFPICKATVDHIRSGIIWKHIQI